MPNSRPIKLRKETKKQTPHLQKKKWPILKGFLGGVISTLGVMGTLLAVWPRIGVEISGPTDSLNSFSLTSVITNNGLLELKNVTVFAGYGKFIMVKRTESFGNIQKLMSIDIKDIPGVTLTGWMAKPTWHANSMKMDEKFSVPIGDLFKSGQNNKLGRADFAVMVSYNIWIFPYSFEKTQRFTTLPKSDGTLEWLYHPNDFPQKYK